MKTELILLLVISVMFVFDSGCIKIASFDISFLLLLGLYLASVIEILFWFHIMPYMKNIVKKLWNDLK